MKYVNIIVLILAIMSMAACRQDEKLSKKAKLIESATGLEGEAVTDSATGEAFFPLIEIDTTEKDMMAKTRITFKEVNVDLGAVTEGAQVKHTFEFKNTGNVPLVIYSAHGSCGCTVPKYSKDPIPPGGTGEINVEFDSNGRLGANTKTVTVNSNTVPQTTTLSFTVMVNTK